MKNLFKFAWKIQKVSIKLLNNEKFVKIFKILKFFHVNLFLSFHEPTFWNITEIFK